MVLYLSIILISMGIIMLFNCLFGGYVFDYNILWVIISTTMCVIVEIALQGLVAFVIHSCPDKWFINKKIFNVSNGERKFYDRLKIKKWKDKVFELGALGGFRKNKIKHPSDVDYLKLFIIESNKGIFIHIFGAIVGAAVLFVLPFQYIFRITLYVWLVGAFLAILPIFVLRYNMPKLQAGYKRALNLQKRHDSIEVDSLNNACL
jgi:hypothetical protein